MFNKAQWQREWRENNKEKYLKQGRDQYLKNRKYFRWKIHYYNAHKRCSSPNGEYYKKGISFNITIEEFKFLWFRDEAYNLKRPSIDRINSQLGYFLDNCRFIELSENSRRSLETKRKK